MGFMGSMGFMGFMGFMGSMGSMGFMNDDKENNQMNFSTKTINILSGFVARPDRCSLKSKDWREGK